MKKFKAVLFADHQASRQEVILKPKLLINWFFLKAKNRPKCGSVGCAVFNWRASELGHFW